MHMALTHHNTVIIFDQTGGPSRYQLRRRSNGTRCEGTRRDLEDSSCYAHSVEYDILSSTIRPLNLQTDTWCSSGSILSNGTLLQTGGFGRGSRIIRYYKPCENGLCDWKQSRRWLSENRWYASSLHLPENDKVMIVGGRGAFTYEFVPKSGHFNHSFALPFLHQTYNRNERGNNLYPFLHFSSDGKIFIFANRDSILFDYKTHKVVKTLPRLPGDGSRSYPSTGSSVILPIDITDHSGKVEVMICGGAAAGAYTAARKGRFLRGLSSCGRMVITGNAHEWKMENMPGPRLMSDMLLLPTGDILLINGAKRGCAGWNRAASPVLEPYLYTPNKTPGHRFSVLRRTRIARMYHSSAIILPDGRILVAGGNPNRGYVLHNVAHPTELRLQAFVPEYMDWKYDYLRPRNVSIYYYGVNQAVEHGERFGVDFWLETDPAINITFMAYVPPFATHSLSMNQRLVRLRCTSLTHHQDQDDRWRAILMAPPAFYVAPAGYYLLAVVNEGIPSKSQWFRIGS